MTECAKCGEPLSGGIDTFGPVGEPWCQSCFLEIQSRWRVGARYFQHGTYKNGAEFQVIPNRFYANIVTSRGRRV